MRIFSRPGFLALKRILSLSGKCRLPWLNRSELTGFHKTYPMKKLISNIVFTKNRPLQLEAYLESLRRHLPAELISTYIIYKHELFDDQYAELFRRFSDCVVIREQNFHDDFIRLLEQINTTYMLFGTDDVVYYDSVDFKTIDSVFGTFSSDIFGFSLRLSPGGLPDESHNIESMDVKSEKIYRLNWKKGRHRNARYPFELNSTIYRTELVKKIIFRIAKDSPILKRLFPKDSSRVRFLSKIISMKHFLISINTFHNPNTLEGYCYRWCRDNKAMVPDHLYFQKICASAIQINQVNTSVDNPVDGLEEHAIEALNEKYRQGYRFDLESLEKNKPETTHVGREYFRLIKKY